MDIKNVLPKDAIPSIDEPEFGHDYFGGESDTVIVLEGEEEVRAYPTRILNYHEIVNDEFEGEKIAVTWCPLCGSGIVYNREVDGSVLTFGVSGKLADDDLVMYDRETESEWKQSLGECIRGEHEGKSLEVLPANMTTWGKFKNEYPEGVVLGPAGGKSEASGEGDEMEEIDYEEEPYEKYMESEGFGLGAHRGQGSRDWEREDIDPKDVVLGIEKEDEAVGFPLKTVEDEGGVVCTVVGDVEVVVFATDEGIHAFENPGYSFESVDGEIRADGSTWDGATGKSDDGRSLEMVGGKRMFAFAWQDDHGEDSFYGLSSGG